MWDFSHSSDVPGKYHFRVSQIPHDMLVFLAECGSEQHLLSSDSFKACDCGGTLTYFEGI